MTNTAGTRAGGGSASIPGVDEMIQEKLGLPTQNYTLTQPQSRLNHLPRLPPQHITMSPSPLAQEDKQHPQAQPTFLWA